MERFIGKKYTQLIACCIVFSYNVCRYLYVPNDFRNTSKTLSFARGYAFANLQVVLISRLPDLKQKIFAVLFSFFVRFTVLAILNRDVLHADTILRHVAVDLFVLYTFSISEKKELQLFQNFYLYREELIKFKELIANYLPQSITVLDITANKHLFSNQAFKEIFESGSDTQTMGETINLVLENEPTKLQLDLLKVNKDSIREVGTLYPSEHPSSCWIYMKDIIKELVEDTRLNQKAILFSASYTFQGQNRTFDVIAMKIKWDKEDSIVFLLNDITYQENLIALKLADENKDKVIATVSHELRTPLTGIIGILGMAEKKVQDPQVREYLSLCQDNAELLLGLVNSLLDLQLIKQGTLLLNPTKMDIRKSLKDIIRLFQFQCNKKGIYLDLVIEKNIPTHIHTDENRLKQILINLIGNAVKFTFNGGITLKVLENNNQPEYITISVTDTGIGIKEEDQRMLFRMYGKLKDGENINKHGIGLGLTISNALAEQLNKNIKGQAIEVSSSYGVGTSFFFQLPKNLNEINSSQNREIKAESKTKSILNTEENRLVEEDNKENIGSECEDEDSERGNLGSKIADHTLLKSINVNESSLSKLDKGFERLITSEENSVKMRECNPNQECILVVDDNTFNLMVAESIIKDLGYQVRTARSGHEAIEILKSGGNKAPAFRVILMDCQMPVMDGFETTKILKEMMRKKEISEIGIVALTANYGEEDVNKCFEYGMEGYLKKPLQKNTLSNTLSKLKHSN